MSISIVLVPMAFAAVAAWKSSKTEVDQHGRTVCQVGTRMRDETLLAGALADVQAAVSRNGEALVAEWAGLRAEFRRDIAGVWQVDFIGDIDQARGIEIVTAVDAAYGRRVQHTVLAQLTARAPAAGMLVSSQTIESDDSITLVLEVGAR